MSERQQHDQLDDRIAANGDEPTGLKLGARLHP
jgi:hypothetical protein